MKYLVFGSLNIDRTYTVPRFTSAGETLHAANMELFCGGKGFNQAVALARAGKRVHFAGAVGADGGILLDGLGADGIDAHHVRRTGGASGHAVIQVDPHGQNSILVLAGANGSITRAEVDAVLADFDAGDLIVLQNEISNVDYILRQAAEKGMVVALNPSPCDGQILHADLSDVSYLLLNETEGSILTGCTADSEILDALHARYPRTNTVLTLGARGACFCGADGRRYSCGIYPTAVVDTTAAGDTFTGYFLARITGVGDPLQALEEASVASGIAVSRKGASPSIPFWSEVSAVGAGALRPFRA